MGDLVVIHCMYRPFFCDPGHGVTPRIRSESCCVSGHVIRMNWASALHLLTFPVADVVGHAREDDPVWKTVVFLPVHRLDNFVAYAVSAQRCHQDTRATQCQSTDLQCCFLFWHQSLFMTASAVFSKLVEALVERTWACAED